MAFTTPKHANQKPSSRHVSPVTPLLMQSDDEWVEYEDEGEHNVDGGSESGFSADGSRRRRRLLRRSISGVRTPPRNYKRNTASVTSTPIRPRKLKLKETTNHWHWVPSFEAVVSFVARYTLSASLRALTLMWWPIVLFVAVWLLLFIATQTFHQVERAFKPFCDVPGLHYLLPICSFNTLPQGGAKLQRADYPHLVEVQSNSFVQLLENNVGGSGLSLEIKKAEMATNDLETMIRASDLTSRELLAQNLENFSKDAKKAGRGLQRLGSKLGGSVDNIMAINDYALRTIETAFRKEASRSSLSKLVLLKWGQTTDEIVTATFSEAMDVLSTQMRHLIVDAQASYSELLQLEESLANLHAMAVREDRTISESKSELLSSLWTKFGGHRKQLFAHDRNLAILSDAYIYRKKALNHVVAALQTLDALESDVEDLRQRVSAPDLVGKSVPVEVHLKSIRSGLERLREGRMRARERDEKVVRKILDSSL